MRIPKLFKVIENNEIKYYALKQVHNVKTVPYKNEICCLNNGYTHLFSDDWFEKQEIIVLKDADGNLTVSKEELAEEMEEICKRYFVKGGIYTDENSVYYCDIHDNIGYFTDLETGRVKKEYLPLLLPWIAEKDVELRKA